MSEDLTKLTYDCYGRTKYYTSLSDSDLQSTNIADIVEKYFIKFLKEQAALKFLDDFVKGRQPILNKTRLNDLAENNKVVVNIAKTALENIKSSFIGEKTQYVTLSSDPIQSEALKDLLKLFRRIEEPAHNERIEGDRGKFGYSYEYPYRDKKNQKIKIKRLKANTTSVVYSEEDEDEAVFAYNYYTFTDQNGNDEGFKFIVYTNSKIFEFKTDLKGKLSSEITESQNDVGIIPIICYPNNDELMGDFEPAISILNTINAIYSKRIDNIADIVEALLIFVNTEIFEETIADDGTKSYDTTKLKLMRTNNVIEIKGDKADVKNVINVLDQANTQIICDNLIRLAFAVMRIEDNVNAKTTGGGDTGEAANTREGYKTKESMLIGKERLFRKSLKQRIEIIKRLSKFDNSKIKDIDVEELDIKFIRSKSLNAQSNAQWLDILENTGLFSPDTIIALSNLCESPQEEIDKVLNKFDDLSKKGIITEEQCKMAKAAYYIPNKIFPNIFPVKTEEKPSEVKDAKAI